jgi:predicted nucleic acid-binding protein
MPANGKFLLDTNVIIALLEGDDAVLSSVIWQNEIERAGALFRARDAA